MCFDSQLGLWQQGFLKEQNLFLLSFGSFSRRQWLIISSNKTTTTNVFTLPFPIFDYSTLHPPAKVEFTRCDSLSSFSVASWGRQSIGPGWNETAAVGELLTNCTSSRDQQWGPHQQPQKLAHGQKLLAHRLMETLIHQAMRPRPSWHFLRRPKEYFWNNFADRSAQRGRLRELNKGNLILLYKHIASRPWYTDFKPSSYITGQKK